jgi:hypothetical protein
MSAYKLTIRAGPKIERVKAETLDEALDALELHARAASNTERLPAVDLRVRRYEPGDQVMVRAELRGPGVSGGVDVLGDGAVSAWTGRIRRRPVDPEDGQSPYEALRAALNARAGIRPAP